MTGERVSDPPACNVRILLYRHDIMAMIKNRDGMAAKKPRRLHWQDPEHTRVKRGKKNCCA
jgi:hypothetical protein